MCLFSVCFKASEDLLPEIGVLVHKIVAPLKAYLQQWIQKIKTQS